MSASIPDIPKSRGRPKTTGRGTAIVVRCHDEQLGPLDSLIAAQSDPKPTRPDVIREALTEHLKAKGYLK